PVLPPWGAGRRSEAGADRRREQVRFTGSSVVVTGGRLILLAQERRALPATSFRRLVFAAALVEEGSDLQDARDGLPTVRRLPIDSRERGLDGPDGERSVADICRDAYQRHVQPWLLRVELHRALQIHQRVPSVAQAR